MLPRLKTRIALIAGTLVLLAVMLFAWFSQHPSAPEVPAAPQASEVRTLRLGLNIAADSALHAAALRFADQVSERSQGKIKVVVHPNQELGNDDQMLEMTRSGKLDLVLTPTAKLSSAIPAMQYADLPFYFSGRDELYAMLDGEPGDILLSKLNSIDLIGLAFWENGFKQFTANTPIRVPQDFARLRIRTMKSPIIADQFASLGAQPIPIDFHATYQALADGAVDGQENPLVAIVGMNFHKVQKHLTLSNHAYLGYVFSASKQVFASLPPDQREIIQRTARDLTVWEREETARRETEFIETIRAAGVTIHPLAPMERAQFSQALAPIADKFGFEVGYDLLAKTDELRFTAMPAVSTEAAKPAAEPLLIGLDADLSGRGAQSGGAFYRGIQLAIEEINQNGGLLGRPVRLIARDNASIPQRGEQNLAHFATLPNLLAVVGGMNTAVIMDELDDIHRLKIPYLIPWAAAQGLISHAHQPSFTFRVSLNDTFVAPYLLEHALKTGSRVTVLLDRSAWGRSNEAALKPLLEKLPVDTVKIEWLNAGDPGTAAKIQALTRDGTQAVVLASNPLESRAVVQAMAQQHHPLPIFAHWALTGGNFWEENQAELSKVDLRFVQSILLHEAAAKPNLQKFVKRYRERYRLATNAPIRSPVGSVQAFDLTHLLARAVIQSQSTDRSVIRTTLESLKPYSGVLRNYNPAFTPDRHDALDRSMLHLARYDDLGHIVSVSVNGGTGAGVKTQTQAKTQAKIE